MDLFVNDPPDPRTSDKCVISSHHATLPEILWNEHDGGGGKGAEWLSNIWQEKQLDKYLRHFIFHSVIFATILFFYENKKTNNTMKPI